MSRCRPPILHKRWKTRELFHAPAIALLFAALAPFARGQSSVTLAWDASTSSGVTAYRLYRGGATGNYTNSVSTGTATTATAANLLPGATYYFAVTAVDSTGLESTLSNEISYSVPVVSNAAPTIALTSPTTGSSYVAPASLSLAASVVPNGHTIVNVQFYNANNLIGAATTAPYTFTWSGAAAGTYSITALLVYDVGMTLSSGAATVTVTAPSTNSSLTFSSTSGTYTAPFVANNGLLYQQTETGVTTGGRAVYNFNVAKTGNYLVSAMMIAPSEGQNSLYVNVDAEPTDPLMIWDVPVCSTLTSYNVSWRGTGGPDSTTAQYQPKVFYLTAGTHQLIIRGREAYTTLGTITVALRPYRIRIWNSGGYTANTGVSQPPAPLGVVLGVDGQPGATYDVQASQDFRTWKSIGTMKVDDTGTGQFTDPAGTTMPARYYRLQEQ